MPKQLTKRGHRLVFSNGILFLWPALVLLIVTDAAKVDRLIPLYAIGVFTSFTLSQAGMAKHHLTHKEPGWRKGIFVNGFGAFLSFVVLIIFIRFKFMEGAWVIILLVPIMVAAARAAEPAVRSRGAPARGRRPRRGDRPILQPPRRARVRGPTRPEHRPAIQYARTLMPDEMRAVHIAWDRQAAEELADSWRTLGLSRVPLELVDCPDRRVARAALDVVAREVGDAKTEVTGPCSPSPYGTSGTGSCHDHTGDEIAAAVTKLEHANVTMVPFQMGEAPDHRCVSDPRSPLGSRVAALGHSGTATSAGVPGPRCAVSSARCGSSPGRTWPPWSASWSTRPEGSCWCSSAAGRWRGRARPRDHRGGDGRPVAATSPSSALTSSSSRPNLPRCRCASWSTG